MLNAPRQLLHNGVRAVDTITASGMVTIYCIVRLACLHPAYGAG